MTASPIPEPDAIERAARLAAEAAVAGVAGLIDDLTLQLGNERSETARLGRLLSNFAQQLTDLQDSLDTERQARIGADADIRAPIAQQLTDLQDSLDTERQARAGEIADLRTTLQADLKLALMERA